jgi:hypothetical protein
VSARLEGRFVSYVERTAIWIPAGVIGVLMLPHAATHRSFGHDWTLHLWAVRQQQWNIEATGHPGLFVSAKPLGALYPVFSFVGSGIYSVGGYVAIALGDRPIVAYKLLYLAGLCLAYGGFTWLSVQVGLRGWRSHVPGAVLVTGAYFVTNMVGRGDLGEFIAVSSIPFLIAAVRALLTSEHVRRRHRLAVIVGAFVLTGSHNISLLWGSLFILLVSLVAVFAWAPTWCRPLPWKRVIWLVLLGAIGAGVNAWYLFSDVAYGLDTIVAKVSAQVRPGTIFSHPALLLNPLRPADHSRTIVSFFARDIRLSFPVLFFAWAFVVAAGLWRGRDWTARRVGLGLLAVTISFGVLCVSSGPWRWLPHIFWNAQFTWRLGSYVLLGTALFVMFALVWQAQASEGLRRTTSILLVTIVVFNVGAATWQVWRVRSEYVTGPYEVQTSGHFAGRVVSSRHVVPPSWYPAGDFRDGSAPVVAVEAGRTLTIPLDQVGASGYSGLLDVPLGPAPFTTNIAGGPRFVRMTGIRAVGRTNDGFVVAVRENASVVQRVRVTLRQAGSGVLRGGAVVSVLSLLALLGVVVWPGRPFLGSGASTSAQAIP